MGLVGDLAWLNNGKKQCRSLFWRVRAGVRAVKKGSKQRMTFKYDPCSYALNFDDGRCEFRAQAHAFSSIRYRYLPMDRNSTRVFVLWVKTL